MIRHDFIRSLRQKTLAELDHAHARYWSKGTHYLWFGYQYLDPPTYRATRDAIEQSIAALAAMGSPPNHASNGALPPHFALRVHNKIAARVAKVVDRP